MQNPKGGASMSPLRAIQLIGVTGIGLLTALACITNITDYGSNFAFVQHVMSMDTTFPDNTLKWRAITARPLHHAAYWLIIVAEGVAGLLCLAGATAMLRTRGTSHDIFHKAKRFAFWGLAVALALYLIGFLVVGGEWFVMWQSATWNGQQAAFRIVTCVGLVILTLLHKDD